MQWVLMIVIINPSLFAYISFFVIIDCDLFSESHKVFFCCTDHTGSILLLHGPGLF